MEDKTIKIGDMVEVWLINDAYFKAEVLHIASEVGDCWHFETDEQIRYVGGNGIVEITKPKN